MPLQQRERGFFEGGHRLGTRVGGRSAVVYRRGVEIFEVRDQLFERGIRQDNA